MDITGLILCDKGCEDLGAIEIAQRLDSKPIQTTANSRIVKTQTTFEKWCQCTYETQSAIRSMVLLAENVDETKLEAELLPKLKDFFTKDITFKVDAISTQQKSQNLATKFGGLVSKEIGCSADMKNPQIQLLVIETENNIYAGVDMSQLNLAKREYKIFTSPATLRASIAFDALLYAEYEPELTLLDPCCGSGTIPIEAGLYASQKSPRFYEKEKLAFTKLAQYKNTTPISDDVITKRLPINGFDSSAKSVDMSKKNAKIADVVQLIRFARCDADWIDTKFEDDQIDRIVTCPPYFSNHVPDEKIAKIFTDIFERAQPILTPNAIIVFITNHPEKVEPLIKPPYKHIETKHVFMGKEELWFVKIRKEN